MLVLRRSTAATAQPDASEHVQEARVCNVRAGIEAARLPYACFLSPVSLARAVASDVGPRQRKQ
jgi:hypothetical protein